MGTNSALPVSPERIGPAAADASTHLAGAGPTIDYRNRQIVRSAMLAREKSGVRFEHGAEERILAALPSGAYEDPNLLLKTLYSAITNEEKGLTMAVPGKKRKGKGGGC